MATKKQSDESNGGRPGGTVTLTFSELAAMLKTATGVGYGGKTLDRLSAAFIEARDG